MNTSPVAISRSPANIALNARTDRVSGPCRGLRDEIDSKDLVFAIRPADLGSPARAREMSRARTS